MNTKLLKLPKKLKLTKLSIRLFLLSLIFLVIVLAFILSVRIYITDPDRFRLEIPLFISCIATICAVVSVVLALRSLEATGKALQLTRITLRPFLTVQPGNESINQREHMVNLEFHMKNTGPVPANIVTAQIAFFDDAEVVEDDNESKHYPQDRQPPQGIVIFPDAVNPLIQNFDLRRAIDKKLFDNIVHGKVKLRFRLTYSAQSIEYVTVQTEKLGKAEQGLITRFPIQPQRWT